MREPEDEKFGLKHPKDWIRMPQTFGEALTNGITIAIVMTCLAIAKFGWPF